MKIVKPLFFTALIAFTIACGGNKSKQAEEDSTAASASEAQDLKQIDLSEYQLNATISIPDDSKGKAELMATDWGSIEVKIDDWYGLEIVPYGMSVIDKKAELKADLVYDIAYLIDKENLIFYKKTITDSELDPEFHFFMTKEIDGELIEIKSSSDQSYTKSQVEKMILSAETLNPKAEI